MEYQVGKQINDFKAPDQGSGLRSNNNWINCWYAKNNLPILLTDKYYAVKAVLFFKPNRKS